VALVHESVGRREQLLRTAWVDLPDPSMLQTHQAPCRHVRRFDGSVLTAAPSSWRLLVRWPVWPLLRRCGLLGRLLLSSWLPSWYAAFFLRVDGRPLGDPPRAPSAFHGDGLDHIALRRLALVVRRSHRAEATFLHHDGKFGVGSFPNSRSGAAAVRPDAVVGEERLGFVHSHREQWSSCSAPSVGAFLEVGTELPVEGHDVFALSGSGPTVRGCAAIRAPLQT